MSKLESSKKLAVALGYDSNSDNAPLLKAKGQGYVAEKLLSKANENDIPVYEDPALAELLSSLNLNESIPEDLYEVVAEVFSFLYLIDKNVHETTTQREK